MSGTKRISALTELATPADADILPIVDMSQASVTDKTKHITVANLVGAGTLERLGATVDGSTDNQSELNSAIVTGGAIDLSADTYYLSTQQVITSNGQLIRGAGKDKTKIILDCSGSAGILFDGAQHCQMKDLTLQGNDTTAPLIQLGDGSGNTISNVFDNIRFIGNSAGSRPAIGLTSHVAVRGVEATSGNSNYFHRFQNCDFDSLYAAFHGDYNANAWFISNAKAQNVWRCFAGGFQEWLVHNFFWHSSAGSGSDYAYFADLYGKNSSNKAQYNNFLGLQLEPGATLTRLYLLDANTTNNHFEGMRQTTGLGTDSGTLNSYKLFAGDKTFSMSTLWTMLVDGLNVRRTGGTVWANFWGNGTTSDTGSQRGIRLHSGGAAETRLMEILQKVGGNATIRNTVAGNMSIESVAAVNIVPTTVLNIANVPTSASGLSSGDVWNDSGTLKIV